MSILCSALRAVGALQEELEAAVELAELAGARLNAAISETKRIASKGVADIVTETDKANEELIFEGLRRRFPADAFIGEESSSGGVSAANLGPNKTWIVDPIDGTTNFVAGLPLTCVSIGLCVGGRPVLGVVFNPCMDEMYIGVRGHGAYLNGQRLKVSDTTRLDEAVVIQEYGYEREDGILALMSTSAALLGNKVRALRQFGSGCLDICWVAAGRCDAVYAGVAHEGLCKGWMPWDYCAGVVIGEEAGAVFKKFDGTDFDIFYRKDFLCCTPGVLDELRGVLNQAAS
eukprot:scaffold385_cov305-Pinguiococcus_pyrenoidosus.AAC.9